MLLGGAVDLGPGIAVPEAVWGHQADMDLSNPAHIFPKNRYSVTCHYASLGLVLRAETITNPKM
jgi:hypothetical protein